MHHREARLRLGGARVEAQVVPLLVQHPVQGAAEPALDRLGSVLVEVDGEWEFLELDVFEP